MLFLLLATAIWSFSFSFIGVYLGSSVDVYFAIFSRSFLALLIFLPFIIGKMKKKQIKRAVAFTFVGMLQLGIMYYFYYSAFNYLTVSELLLFTVTTPIYITLFSDILNHQRFQPTYLFCVLLSVIGAIIIRYNEINSLYWQGFFLVQCANLCFAFGQIFYKKLKQTSTISHYQACFWLYFGATVVTAILWLFLGDFSRLPTTSIQWSVLIWLGVMASGVGYFLWNFGATQVDATTSAIVNNLIIPAGIAVNLIFFPSKDVNWTTFILGSAIILFSLFVHYYLQRRK